MRNKKLMCLLGATILSFSLLVSCGKGTQETAPVEQSAEALLNTYTEEGMEILKNNYVTTEDMKFALKNIGLDVSNMKFKTYDGKEIKLSDYRGKNIILEVSQANCNSCRASVPAVREIMKDKKDIELIPLFLNSKKEEIDEFFNSIKLNKDETIIVDNDKVSKDKFGLTKTPSYIFIDSTGKISFVREKFTDSVIFKEDLERAFGDKKIYEYKDN